MSNRRRVYPLDSRALSEEQIAVTFAMTSRCPEPFDETARQVSEATAADFHERWVVGYGHASIAEHAVVRLSGGRKHIPHRRRRPGRRTPGLLHRKILPLPSNAP